MKALPLFGAALAMMLVSSTVSAGELTLQASKNNTLYQTEDGSLSNGAGQYIFAGNSSGQGPFNPAVLSRRALVAFDIAGSIPPGSTINSVVLTLEMSRTTSGAQTVALHRVLNDWGEGASIGQGPEEGGGGPSEPGDATWINTFYPDAFWDVAGGEFVGDPSATQEVDALGSYQWSSAIPAGAGVADMVSDVQSWLDDPSTNYGWILTGNEADARTSKRFNSRHNAAAPPSLTIDYTPPVSDCVGDCDNTGEVNVDDVTTGINIVLGFLPVSACPAFAIDGVVTILSLIQGVDNLLTGCPSGAFIDYVCQTEFTSGPDSPSRLEIITAAFSLPLPFDAAIRTVCNEQLSEGIYSCQSELLSAAPITIPVTGAICSVPGAFECPLGVIDCVGGLLALGTDTTADSDVISCTSNEECGDECDFYCAELDAVVAGGGCTGYCSGGENDGNACLTDADCPGGSCNGPDGGPIDICQCQCINLTAPSEGAPGESQSFIPITFTIEAEPPCDGMDVIAFLGDFCTPIATTTVSDVILNANFESGSTVPSDGPFVSSGSPLDCETLHTGTATGLEAHAALNVLGSAIGDIVIGTIARCQ